MPYKNMTKKEYMKQWRLNNKKRVAEYNKNYCKKYYQEHKEDLDIKNKAYYWKHKDEILKYHKQYDKENKEARGKYQRNRYRTDLKYKLNHSIRVAIQIALRGNKKGRDWESLVGYTLNDLMKRLRKTMPKGYDWNDYLEGKLHIDHIIPISAHNYTQPEHSDFLKCWALKNLQLLPAKDNIIKRGKLSRPFQPALAI